MSSTDSPLGRTSIGFGGGEVIVVHLPLDTVRKLVQKALRRRVLVEFENEQGELLVVNPIQVKVLQRA